MAPPTVQGFGASTFLSRRRMKINLEADCEMRKLIILGAIVLAMLFTAQQGLAEAGAAQITIRGRLQKTVEPGGWLVVADGQKYLLLNAQRFQRKAGLKRPLMLRRLATQSRM